MAQTVHRRQKRRMTTRQIVLTVAGGVGAIVLVLVVIALVNLKRATSIPPPPPEAQQSQSVTASGGYQVAPLQTQIQQATLSAVANPTQPVSLYLRPEDVVRELAPSLGGSGVQDLVVYCGNGTIGAQGVVMAGKRRLHATVRLRPQVESGGLKLELVDAKIGTMPMPSSLRRQLEEELAKATAGGRNPLNQLYLDSVQAAPGLLTITGRPQG